MSSLTLFVRNSHQRGFCKEEIYFITGQYPKIHPRIQSRWRKQPNTTDDQHAATVYASTDFIEKEKPCENVTIIHFGFCLFAF